MKNMRFYIHAGIIFVLSTLTGLNANQPLPVTAQGNGLVAATLYVDGSIGVNQCDTYNPTTRSCGSGSDIAYLTIVDAAAVVQSGDIVLIQPGTYDGGITVETSGTAGEPITFHANGPGVVIEGSGGDRDAFFITWADYIVVDGLTIQHANRAGVRIDNSNHVTVRNCTFADNGTWGLFTDFSDYTTVENSEAYGSVDQHGIYISNSSDFPTIRGNRLHDNNDCGLHMNGDISQGGDGIISYAVVENNIVYENGLGGGSGINMDGVTDSVVRNNLLYNNHASGISLYQIDGGSPSHHNRVLNNTILMPANGRWALNIPDTENNKLFNNIVLNDHTYRGSILIGTPVSAGFESDYNVVIDRFANDGEGNTILTLTEWQALGYDQHSFIADPSQLFVNEAGNDYHLTTSSPAIDQGTVLADVLYDLEGKPRPVGGGYDIGAYEHQPGILLSGVPGNRTISLTWEVNVILPDIATWTIDYQGPAGDQPSPITGLPDETRSYTLTGLTNYEWYDITLTAIGFDPELTDTVRLMPTDMLVYLPLVSR
jgi:parallel beta-helix repeat protein